MRVHLQKYIDVSPWYRSDAVATWKREGLVPFLVRNCDGRMVTIKRELSLTSNSKDVTCKRCMRLKK